MKRIHSAKKLTDNRYLNLFELDVSLRSGAHTRYYVSSRRKEAAQLKACGGDRRADGVILYGVYGEAKDRIVLIRQYRYPAGCYVYEFPAGLVEENEEIREAGVREMWEETGLEFRPKEGGSCCRPFYTSVGMTDESCALLFGYCSGVPTSTHQEDGEDIEVVLADRAECARILREEQVAVMSAYMMMHFIAGVGDPLRFLEEEIWQK